MKHPIRRARRLAELTAGSWPEELRPLPSNLERRFCIFYMVHGNATRAAREAGYNANNRHTMSVIASKVLHRERVQTALQALADRQARDLIDGPEGATVARLHELKSFDAPRDMILAEMGGEVGLAHYERLANQQDLMENLLAIATADPTKLTAGYSCPPHN